MTLLKSFSIHLWTQTWTAHILVYIYLFSDEHAVVLSLRMHLNLSGFQMISATFNFEITTQLIPLVFFTKQGCPGLDKGTQQKNYSVLTSLHL